MSSELFCGRSIADIIQSSCLEFIWDSEYYDGPVSGILRCRDHSEYCRFDMLDWDSKQRIRIYGIAHLPSDINRDIETYCADETSGAHFEDIEKLIQRAPFIELVIANDKYTGQIIAAYDVRERRLKFSSVPYWNRSDDSVDWFQELKIAKG